MSETTDNSKNIQTVIDDMESVIPPMNVTVPAAPMQEQRECLISDDVLLGVYAEILDTARQDRKEISGMVDNFCEMVFNEGDGSSASKEALVALMKAKSDILDKVTKVADLMTRHVLRDRATRDFAVTATQENHVHLNDSKYRKSFLKKINQKLKQKNLEKSDDESH